KQPRGVRVGALALGGIGREQGQAANRVVPRGNEIIALAQIGGKAAVYEAVHQRIEIGAPLKPDSGPGASAENRYDWCIVSRPIQERIGRQLDRAQHYVALSR